MGRKQGKVTYNLEAALQVIRHEKESRILWVDALCINQADLEERNEQVKSMARIYSQATKVLAWLGEEDVYDDLAYDTLEELCWASKVFVWKYFSEKLDIPLTEISDAVLASLIDSELADPVQKPTSPFQDLLQTHIRSDFLKALHLIPLSFEQSTDLVELAISTFGNSTSLARFLVSQDKKLSELPDLAERIQAIKEVFGCRSYWERLWVVQEIHNASEGVLLCGNRRMHFSMMTLLVVAIWNGAFSLVLRNNMSDRETLATVRDSWVRMAVSLMTRSSTRRTNLAHLLSLYNGLECSEPRDKIFSLLNICEPTGINVNYRKPLADIFIDATKSVILQEQNLNIICSSQSWEKYLFRPLRRIQIPSWVPDYSSDLEFWFGATSRNWHIYYKGGGQMSIHDDTLKSRDAKMLEVRGCFYGKIKHVMPVSDREYLTEDELWNTASRIKEVISTAHGPSALSDRELWRLILFDIYRRDDETAARMEWDEEARNNFDSDIEVMTLRGSMPESFYTQATEPLVWKQFCTTTKGNLVLVGGPTRVGDNIFIARGAMLPFVLRPMECREAYPRPQQTSITPRYKLVGGCYVHDVMDGQPLAEMESKGIRDAMLYLA